jgi:hypothetical protein
MRDTDALAEEIAQNFAARCNISKPDFNVVDKAGDKYLSLVVGRINEVYATELRHIDENLGAEHEFRGRLFLRERTPECWLHSLECQLLQRVLSESLTVGRATLDSDFHKRYIPSLAGEEARIFTKTNHVVFGRRGAGKSSLSSSKFASSVDSDARW